MYRSRRSKRPDAIRPNIQRQPNRVRSCLTARGGEPTTTKLLLPDADFADYADSNRWHYWRASWAGPSLFLRGTTSGSYSPPEVVYQEKRISYGPRRQPSMLSVRVRVIREIRVRQWQFRRSSGSESTDASLRSNDYAIRNRDWLHEPITPRTPPRPVPRSTSGRPGDRSYRVAGPHRGMARGRPRHLRSLRGSMAQSRRRASDVPRVGGGGR